MFLVRPPKISANNKNAAINIETIAIDGIERNIEVSYPPQKSFINIPAITIGSVPSKIANASLVSLFLQLFFKVAFERPLTRDKRSSQK